MSNFIIHDHIHQGHEEWDNWRDVRLTASNFGMIFTGGGKISEQREAYLRKCAIARRYSMPKWGGNASTDRGKELEPIARARFIELTGLDVREVACMEHENGLCGASPDGLIYSPEGRPVSGLEIKCYNYEKHVPIVTSRKMPVDCKPQVHGAMFISQLLCWQFMAFHPDALPFDMRIIEVERDSYTDALENEVLRACEELDRRADEFIADFEKNLNAPILQTMPILRRELGQGGLI